MTPATFKAWRFRNGLTQDGAAKALSISKFSVINYENGTRRDNGKTVKIPLHIVRMTQIVDFRRQVAELPHDPAIDALIRQCFDEG